MFRTASRAVPRGAGRWAQPRLRSFRRQQLSTAPPHQLSRSWRNSAARWGIAIAGIYWYNTTNVFAEQPAAQLTQPQDESNEDRTLPTLDSLSPAARRKQRAAEADTATASPTQIAAGGEEAGAATTPLPGDDIEGLEDEAHSEGAFNPETGEINWDCPCLGGMAHGPCGPEFREAFSCFVYSTEEPKGMDCIDRFKHMQNCFRLHPDVYGAELEGDDDEDVVEEGDTAGAVAIKGVGHEDAGVAAAAPEDAPHVAALAEKIREKDRAAPSQPTEADAGTAASPPHKETAQVSAKDASSVPKEPQSRDQDDQASAPSQLHKTPQADKRWIDVEDAEEAVVPRAAHDARDAPVPKKTEK